MFWKKHRILITAQVGNPWSFFPLKLHALHPKACTKASINDLQSESFEGKTSLDLRNVYQYSNLKLVNFSWTLKWNTLGFCGAWLLASSPTALGWVLSVPLSYSQWGHQNNSIGFQLLEFSPGKLWMFRLFSLLEWHSSSQLLSSLIILLSTELL